MDGILGAWPNAVACAGIHVGYITRGRGVTVTGLSTLYVLTDTDVLSNGVQTEVRLRINEILVEGVDRPGLFAEITRSSPHGLQHHQRHGQDGLTDWNVNIQFETHDLDELKKVVAGIRQIEGIITVKRVFGKGR